MVVPLAGCTNLKSWARDLGQESEAGAGGLQRRWDNNRRRFEGGLRRGAAADQLSGDTRNTTSAEAPARTRHAGPSPAATRCATASHASAA
ncbi:hypothetical protein DIPPA_01781 [Diplonema papillatum]|nr:hypothetical protein DIPPA_01781 [Diplonema papillatum]